MRILVQLAIAAGLVLLPIAAGHAQPTEIEAEGEAYSHKSVEVEFPEQLGDFARTRIVEYDGTGANASIGYRLANIQGEITLYLYPLGGASCAEHHQDARQAIENRNGTQRAGAASFEMPGFELAEQISSTWDIVANGYGYEHPALVSYLWVGCVPGDEWIVKMRGSFYASDENLTRNAAESLFRQIDWRPLARFAR